MCERCWGKAFRAAYGIGSKTQAGEYERIVASCSCTQAQKRGVVDSFAEGYAAREKEIEELRAKLVAANKAIKLFTSVNRDKIYDHTYHTLMLPKDVNDAIINAHKQGDL